MIAQHEQMFGGADYRMATDGEHRRPELRQAPLDQMAVAPGAAS